MFLKQNSGKKNAYYIFAAVFLICASFIRGDTFAQSDATWQYANAEAGWQWRASSDGITYIPVCWENPGTFSTEKQWVRNAIAETWERVANLSLYGWSQCRADNRGIRIRISDTRPWSYVGRHIDGRANGMSLNFTFRNFSSSCRAENRREYCIKSVAVHEFGHALGFAHEQDRDDSPCHIEQSGGGGWMITEYDAESVMNYCNPRWNNDGKLSALDIKGIQTLYGAKVVKSKGTFTVKDVLDTGSGQVWENVVVDFSNTAGAYRQFFNVSASAATQSRTWNFPGSGVHCYKIWTTTRFTNGKDYSGYGEGCVTLEAGKSYSFNLVQVGWNPKGYFNLKIQNAFNAKELV